MIKIEGIGRVNRYICTKCKAVHGTIKMNNGVTPFMIGCKNCDGRAQSSFYRLPAGEIGCSWVWYRPIPELFRRLTVEEQEHILSGGLILGELESFVHLQESDEVYEIIQSDNLDAWLQYIYSAYKPNSEMFQRVSTRLKGSPV